MKKTFFLCTLVIAGVLMFKMNQGELTTTDVLQMSDFGLHNQPIIEEKEVTEAEGYFHAFEGPLTYHDLVFGNVGEITEFEEEPYGAILSPNLLYAEELAEFFLRLKETRQVDTFILLGENHSWLGKENVLVSKYGYESPFGKIEPELEIADKILELEMVDSSFWAFKKENSINTLIPFIEKTFPKAEVVPVIFKDFSENAELDQVVEVLKEELGEDVFVIASSEFSQQMHPLVENFHQELSRNVLETFDYEGIAQMDVDSRPVIYTFMKLMEENSSRKLVEVDSEANLFVAEEGEPVSEDRDLTVMAFGDMMLGRYVRTLMNEYGKDYIFANIAGYENRFFEGADIVFGNLEGPINGQGTSGGTAMVFSFNEDIGPFLSDYGFNLFSISNNHAVDQGWGAVDTTRSVLENSDIGWCGHPSEADPESVYYGEVGEKKYAFVCLHDVTYKLDDESAVKLIKEVRPQVDFLLVSIHWGYEYKHSPDLNSQVSPGRAFIDAGADFVIGHHPHVVQTFEEYKGKYIFYSLGNFVFDQYWSKDTQEELAIGIVLGENEQKVYLFPMKSESSQSRLMNEEEWSEWIERFINYGEYSEQTKSQIRSGILEISGENGSVL